MMHINVYSLWNNLRVCEFIISIKLFLFLSKQYLFKINKIEKLGLELKLYIFIYQYYIHNLLHFDPSFF